jgi:deoxyribonuclease V
LDLGPGWPSDASALIELQKRLANFPFEPLDPCWVPQEVGGVFVCFGRGRSGKGVSGEKGWAAAVRLVRGKLVEWRVVEGQASFPYEPGLLALREGPLLEKALRSLAAMPEFLFVNATGRDHPRRAGLALHLGALLAIPTVGVTRSPLVAEGELPSEERGAWSPLRLEGEEVAYWVRTKTGVAPLVVHPGWRMGGAQARRLLLAYTGLYRTPEPLRLARQKAREARSGRAS